VGRDYLVLLVAIPALALLLLALGHFNAPIWVLIAGGQLAFLLAFALIGSVLHEHRLELGIEHQTLHERIAERTERELTGERHRMMDHAYMKFRVGKPLEGWQEIHTWLQSQRTGDDPAGNYPPAPAHIRSRERPRSALRPALRAGSDRAGGGA
jgi:hypothetical protein